MGQFIIRRLLAVIPTLLVVYTVTFVVMHATPGGPWDNSEKPLPKAVIENIKAKYHLDQPMWKQYYLYLWGVLHGDFGPSYVNTSQDASDIVRNFFPVSLQLGFVAMIIGVTVGLTLGVLAAIRQNTFTDYGAMFAAVVGISTPSYVTATLLIVTLSLTFHLVPTSGWDGIFSTKIIIPALALSFAPAAALARYARSSTLEVLRQDYVRTARAKGLRSTAIIVRHVAQERADPGGDGGWPDFRRYRYRIVFRRNHLRRAGHRPLLRHRSGGPRLSGADGGDAALRRGDHHDEPARRYCLRVPRPPDPILKLSPARFAASHRGGRKRDVE